MPNCPHCSESIEKLEGFVPQSTLVSRLDAKNQEIKALGDAVTTLRTKTEGYGSIVAERDGLIAKLTGIEQKGTRTAALTEAGLSVELLDSVEQVYGWATSGADDAPAFAEWLAESGKAHPLLAPHFGAPSSAPQAPAPSTPQIPATAAGTAPAGGPKGARTAADAQAFADSSAYRNMSTADKRAAIQRLKTEDGVV